MNVAAIEVVGTGSTSYVGVFGVVRARLRTLGRTDMVILRAGSPVAAHAGGATGVEKHVFMRTNTAGRGQSWRVWRRPPHPYTRQPINVVDMAGTHPDVDAVEVWPTGMYWVMSVVVSHSSTLISG